MSFTGTTAEDYEMATRRIQEMRALYPTPIADELSEALREAGEVVDGNEYDIWWSMDIGEDAMKGMEMDPHEEARVIARLLKLGHSPCEHGKFYCEECAK